MMAFSFFPTDRTESLANFDPWIQAPSENLDGDHRSEWLRKGHGPQRVMAVARQAA
jgi:hypothetical protein